MADDLKPSSLTARTHAPLLSRKAIPEDLDNCEHGRLSLTMFFHFFDCWLEKTYRIKATSMDGTNTRKRKWNDDNEKEEDIEKGLKERKVEANLFGDDVPEHQFDEVQQYVVSLLSELKIYVPEIGRLHSEDEPRGMNLQVSRRCIISLMSRAIAIERFVKKQTTTEIEAQLALQSLLYQNPNRYVTIYNGRGDLEFRNDDICYDLKCGACLGPQKRPCPMVAKRFEQWLLPALVHRKFHLAVNIFDTLLQQFDIILSKEHIDWVLRCLLCMRFLLYDHQHVDIENQQPVALLFTLNNEGHVPGYFPRWMSSDPSKTVWRIASERSLNRNFLLALCELPAAYGLDPNLDDILPQVLAEYKLSKACLYILPRCNETTLNANYAHHIQFPKESHISLLKYLHVILLGNSGATLMMLCSEWVSRNDGTGYNIFQDKPQPQEWIAPSIIAAQDRIRTYQKAICPTLLAILEIPRPLLDIISGYVYKRLY